MKKRINILIALACLVLISTFAHSQTTKTVGSSGANYSTLKLAFDAINAGNLKGAVTLQIIGNTTETASAVLNASGSGSASYSSVKIYPTSSGFTISGNLNSRLIELNGADDVTIDGRPNESGSSKTLTITNTNTGTSASTIRFINSAENNTIRYCTIKGAETSASSGIIHFTTSANGNGNDNNLIENNNITADETGKPVNAIYSSGTTARENSGNTIFQNNIFNIWRTTSSSYSIHISSYSTGWKISGNSFYETSTLVPTGAWTYTPIKISNSAGINFIISDNYIGGQAEQCGGSALTVNSSTTHVFQGIYLSVGTTTASSIQNNTIKNFNYTSSQTSPWHGIYISTGNVNIGTEKGNTIGDVGSTGSISVKGTVTGTTVYGINFTGSGTIVIQNNVIASITANNSNAAYASNIYGINRTNTGTSTISYNTIGSTTTANSIQSSSASTSNAQSVFGIRNTTGGNLTINKNTIANLSNGTTNTTAATLGLINGISSNSGINAITNNIIRDLSISNANTASSNSASVTGIAVASTNALNTISGNTIYNLSNSYASFAGSVIGLYFGSTGMYTTVSHTVTENFIHSLSLSGSSSTTASIYGIKINTGQTTYANNIISIGTYTETTIYGIYEIGTSSNNNSIYFNTVYIWGSSKKDATNKSYAIYSSVTTNTRNFRNNIFVNTRSTKSGSNLHYAAYFNYSVSTSLTLNYNDYYASGYGGVLGYFNGSNKTSLPIVTGQDANSLAIDAYFKNGGGTEELDYYPSASLTGVSITGITTDYYGLTRGSTPKIGAIESNIFAFEWQGISSSQWDSKNNWDAKTLPNKYTKVIITSDKAVSINSTDAICGEIEIDGSSGLIINAGKKLEVMGDITLKSNNKKVASFVDNGTLVMKGTGKVERDVVADGWHYVSSPVNESLSNVFWGSALYFYSESNGSWEKMLAGESMQAMRGYDVYYKTTDKKVNFHGKFNTGDFSMTVTNNRDGWNLIGNPYPSVIDWDASSGWTKTNIDNAIYIWDPAQQTYMSYVNGSGTNGGSRYISPTQAFWVKCNKTNGTGTLGMSNDIRLHNQTITFRNEEASNQFTVKIEGNSFSDEAVIKFDNNASETFDFAFDATKILSPSTNVPQIFTGNESDSTNYSINSLPLFKEQYSVQLSFKPGIAGKHDIIPNLTKLDQQWNVILEDRQNNVYHDLKTGKYAFNAEFDDNNLNRFYLHFYAPKQISGISNKEIKTPENIYSAFGSVYIFLSDSETATDSKVIITDMIGHTVYSGNMKDISDNTVTFAHNSGYYMVNITSTEKTLCKLVFLD